MIDITAQKLEALQASNASALCLDLEKEPLIHTGADYIFLVQTLLHIQDTKAILTKLFHLLHKGGHLIIIDYDKNDTIRSTDVHKGFHQHSLSALAKSTGFSRTESQTFYSGKHIFMNQDASLFIMDCEK